MLCSVKIIIIWGACNTPAMYGDLAIAFGFILCCAIDLYRRVKP